MANPDGLHEISEARAKQEVELEKKFIEEERKHLEQLTKTLGGFSGRLSQMLPQFTDQIRKQQELVASEIKSRKELQVQREREIQLAKDKGASSKDIDAIIKKYRSIEQESRQVTQSSLDDFKRKLAELVSQGELSAENHHIAKKQLVLLEKSVNLSEAHFNKQLELQRSLFDTLHSIDEQYKRQEAERKKAHKKTFWDAAVQMLGPLRLILDPAMAAIRGQDTKGFVGNFFDKRRDKREAQKEYKRNLKELDGERARDERLADFEESFTVKSGKGGKGKKGKKGGSGGSSSRAESVDSYFEEDSSSLGSSNVDTDVMDKISPDESTLLSKGGVVGAGFVYLARQLGVDSNEGGKKQGKKEKDGGLGSLSKIFTKGSLKAAVPLLAIAAGTAMFAGAAKLQKRDSEDAKKYEGARAAETWLLGDRAHTTEATVGRELGRTTGKAGLALGGIGLGAAGIAGVGGMIGAVGSAGGLAAAGGLGAVGAAGIAAMAPVLAVAAPVALVGAGLIATAKGVQQAFELEYDKNQATIQKDLHEIMYSSDSSVGEKLKAGVTSMWKGFTGTIAGGIREASEVLDAESTLQKEKQMSLLEDLAASGDVTSANLLKNLQSEDFQAMSKKDQKKHLKSLGLYDAYKSSQKATSDSTRGLKAVDRFFKGVHDTRQERLRGKATASWRQQILKGKSFGSEEEKAAYIAEMEEKAKASGLMREDGILDIADPVEEFMKKTTEGFKKLFGKEGGFTKAFNKVKEGFGKNLDDIKNTFNGAKEAFGEGGVKGVLSFLGNNIRNWASETISDIRSSVNNARDWLTGNRGYNPRMDPNAEFIPVNDPSGQAYAAQYMGTQNDAVFSKDGKVWSLSEDDNVYATKNTFNVQDRAAQAAMPGVPRTPREFTDTGIIQAIQILTEVLKGKEMQPVVIQDSNQTINFDQYRMASFLI